ncbi:MAG: C1 family peptidase [Bdellovibrionota bacterium]
MMRLFATGYAFAFLLTWGGSAWAAGTVETFEVKDYGKKFATGLLEKNAQDIAFEQAVPRALSNSKAVVPARYSMRGKAGPVENQGSCGSCWDFSLTSVLRGTKIMSGKDPGRLSFNYLLNCDRQMYGCNGGTFSAASYLDNPRGAPAYGSDGAYTARQSSCVSRSPVASAVRYHMLGSSGGNPSFRDIAYVLGVLHRPVSVDVYANAKWQSYGGGVFNGCTQARSTNHMVAIEGYDCESSVDSAGNCVFDQNGNLPPGVGTWIVRNSWGKNWGNGGYMTSKATDRQGQRCNALASSALYFDIPAVRAQGAQQELSSAAE